MKVAPPGAAVHHDAVNNWRVLGVDACKSGWIGIALSEGAVSAYAAAEIGGLVEEAAAGGPLAVIAVDIPSRCGAMEKRKPSTIST